MESSRELASMVAEALRDLSATLLTKLAEREAQISERDAALSLRDALIATRDKELKTKQLKINQPAHEMAILKHYRFDARAGCITRVDTFIPTAQFV